MAHCRGSRPLVIPLFPNSGILLVFLVHLVQCTDRDRARLDSSDERLVPWRILLGWLRGDQRARAEAVVPSERNVALPVLPDPCVAARVVEYAMATNVKSPPRTAVPLRVPAYFVSGLQVVCV